ncbi:MAG TPA: 30S ribosomal protein S8 [Candidatus Azoamicus sp. OHIO2]
MNIQDPISDIITQLRNGYLAKKEFIVVYSSKIILNVIIILKNEFFIKDYLIINEEKNKTKIKIILRYYGKKQPIIKKITRLSKPSLRIYNKYKNLEKIANGFGISIISTSKGIMTDKDARKKKCGGEVLCTIE